MQASGKVIDTRVLSITSGLYERHELVVEVTTQDGPKRFRIKEPANGARVDTADVGGRVPVPLSASGDKAKLDVRDSSINLKARHHANDREATARFDREVD